MIIDTEIFEGMLTQKIHKGLHRIDSKRELLSLPVTAIAPTLELEMRDLNRVLFKSVGRRMRVIKDLIQYPSFVDGTMITMIEYDIRNPDDSRDE